MDGKVADILFYVHSVAWASGCVFRLGVGGWGDTKNQSPKPQTSERDTSRKRSRTPDFAWDIGQETSGARPLSIFVLEKSLTPSKIPKGLEYNCVAVSDKSSRECHVMSAIDPFQKNREVLPLQREKGPP